MSSTRTPRIRCRSSAGRRSYSTRRNLRTRPRHPRPPKYALKLALEGLTVVNLSPGLVDTLALVMAEFERKGLKALMQTPAQSVRLQLEAIYGLTKEQNGLILSPTTKVPVPALAPKSE